LGWQIVTGSVREVFEEAKSTSRRALDAQTLTLAFQT